MIKTRQAYVLDRDAFTAARTITESIDIVDMISAIDIIVEMTNGSAMTEASVVKPHDEFTKIEVVDGSEVLCSASMEELQALNVLERGVLPFMELNLDDDAVQREACRIHFGRWLNDSEFYLNPGDYKNLQIRVTNTLTTPAVTAWAASGHYLTIIAHIMESGYATAMGFLQTKSQIQYTVVDAQVKVVELPVDYAYRAMMVQTLMTAKRPDESISHVKLSCDTGKFIPFDTRMIHLLAENVNQLGAFQQRFKKRITGDADAYGDLYYLTSPAASQDTTLSCVGLCTATAEKVDIEVLIGAAGVNEQSAVEGLVDLILTGYSLHSCVYLPMGNLKTPDDWFRAQDYQDIDLHLTGAAGLGVTKVLTQEWRTK